MQSRQQLYATNNKRQNSRSSFKLTEMPHIYIRIRFECVHWYLYSLCTNHITIAIEIATRNLNYQLMNNENESKQIDWYCAFIVPSSIQCFVHLTYIGCMVENWNERKYGQTIFPLLQPHRKWNWQFRSQFFFVLLQNDVASKIVNLCRAVSFFTAIIKCDKFIASKRSVFSFVHFIFNAFNFCHFPNHTYWLCCLWTCST